MGLKQILLGTFVVLGIALSQSHALPSLSPLQKELLTKIKKKMGSRVVDVLCTNPDGAEVSLKLEILKENLPKIAVESANEYYILTEAGTRYKCQKSAF
jgi:hypothetical protein